jgi:GNAT superfamily N-acetyltransferase
VTATEQRLRETLFGERPAAEILLASSEGETVGFAVFFTNYSTFLAKRGLYLEDLFVKPHGRGKGIGKALLARLAKIAVERDCGRVDWSVLNWNEPSIRFYDALGAVALSDWTTYRLTGEPLAKLAGL